MKHQLDRPARPRRASRLKPVALTAAAVAAFGLTVGAALAASAFNDVTDNHPASAEITAAHQVGVFQGYGDGTFRPDGKLTRGQAELVIHRMLTWQGTDDDGNFEISRADAAVLAMSGLCGLDPDRIPGCAAVGAPASEAEVQAAYNRGFDDGLDAATPTGSTPPPVTAPPAPATSAQKCEDRNGFFWTIGHAEDNLYGTGTGWYRPPFSGYGYYWHHQHVADFPNGFVCTEYHMRVTHDLRNPDGNEVEVDIYSRCWKTKIDPVSGLEYELRGHYRYSDIDPLSTDRYYRGDAATPIIRASIAGDRPDPEYWPAHDPADCLDSALY